MRSQNREPTCRYYEIETADFPIKFKAKYNEKYKIDVLQIKPNCNIKF